MTRQPIVGFLFVAPLWLVYELSALAINHGWTGHLRTGMDLLLRIGLSKLGISPAVVFVVPLLALSVYFFVKRRPLKLRAVYFAYMFVESLFYALVFGIVIGNITQVFISPNTANIDQQRLAVVVLHLGAGVYEEFLFRFLLISGAVLILSRFVKSNMAWSIAVLASSLAFALFHYLAVFGEALTLDGFLFRFVAGLALSGIFLLRGLGIAAYTHALYNLLLMFR